jgi:hypothetical protein
MRRPHPHHSAHDLAATQARVIERLEAGMTVKAVGRLPGFPSQPTLYRMICADPDFARRMAAAQAWGRGVRQGNRNTAELYDEARAQALLTRVRLGEPIRRLVGTRGWPNRQVLNLWKRMRPDFAAALAVAWREAQTSKPLAFPYDEATADRILFANMRGTRLADVLKAPGMPSWAAVQRWRKARPEFAGALRSAQLECLRVRCRTRRQDTPRMLGAVERHVVDGGSLLSASRRRNLPNRNTLYEWMKTRPEFARRVAEAEAWRDDRKADEKLERGLRAAKGGTAKERRAAMRAMGIGKEY